jgi:nitrogen fixation NifU-like protein
MHVSLDATRAMIKGARFKAYGCSATIAAGSFATEWLAGRQVADVVDLTEAVITDALDLSPEEAHAAALAVRVARAAVTDGTQGAGR